MVQHSIVAAHSTLGGKTFFAQKHMYEKLLNIEIFHDICLTFFPNFLRGAP